MTTSLGWTPIRAQSRIRWAPVQLTEQPTAAAPIPRGIAHSASAGTATAAVGLLPVGACKAPNAYQLPQGRWRS